MAEQKQKHIIVSVLIALMAATLGHWLPAFGTDTPTTLTVTLPPAPTAVINGLPTAHMDPMVPITLTVGGDRVNEYKYKLDSGEYSAARPISQTIDLVLDVPGSHWVYVVGGTGTPSYVWQEETNATLGSIYIGQARKIYVPVCGNGILDSANGETCDDGNTANGDGCAGDCKKEPALLTPSNCIATPDYNSIQWQWQMPAGASEQTGFRLTKIEGATELTLGESTSPALLSMPEINLISNTPYFGRYVYAISGQYKSGPVACLATYTKMPPPALPLVVDSTIVSIRASVPKSYVINNIQNGSTGFWYEIRENVTGQLSAIENSGWTKNTDISFFGLKPDTEYVLSYKARNNDGVETALSPQVFIKTKPVAGKLEISKIANSQVSGEAEIGERLTYRIIYTNRTTLPLSQISINDVLSPAVKYVAGSLAVSDPNLQVTYDQAANQIKARSNTFNEMANGWIEYRADVVSPLTVKTVENQAKSDYTVAGTQAGSVSGKVTLKVVSSQLSINLFIDLNLNGTQDVTETAEGLGTPKVILYLDSNANNKLDPQTDRAVFTQNVAKGSSLINELKAGIYFLSVPEVPLGYSLGLANIYRVALARGQSAAATLAFEPIITEAGFDITAAPEKRVLVKGVPNLRLSAALDFYNKTKKAVDISEQVQFNELGKAEYKSDKIQEGAYDISLKGLNHLAKILRNVPVKKSRDAVLLDFTLGNTFRLIAGDVFPDNIINSFDITKTLISYTKTGANAADLNLDYVVNAPDIALLILNYFKKGEKFE